MRPDMCCSCARINANTYVMNHYRSCIQGRSSVIIPCVCVCVCLMHKNILSSVPHCHMCVRRSQPSRHYSGFSIHLLQCFAFFFYMHLNRVACSIVFSSVSLFYIPSFFLSFNYDFSNTIYGCLAASCACDSQSICLLNKTHFANNRLMALRKLYVFTNLIFGFRLI